MVIPKPVYVILCLIIPLAWGLLTDFIFTKIGSLRRDKDDEGKGQT